MKMRPASILFCLLLSILTLAGQVASDDDVNADYYFSRGEAYDIDQNYPEAFKWYKRAAELGHSGGQNGVGALYLKGLGVSQDYHKAQQWLHKSADQGYAMAQVNLAYLYYTGKGVAQNISKAEQLLLTPAKQGHHQAMMALSTLYDRQGKIAEAISWAWVAWTVARNYDDEQAARSRRLDIIRQNEATREVVDRAEALTNSLLQEIP